MKTTLLKMLTITVLTLIAGTATAGLLTLADFAGATPETFDGYDLPTIVQDVDFGPFSISGYFDSYAYYMPVAPPVVTPAIGGDNLTITMDSPQTRVGFEDDGGELIHRIELGSGDQYIDNFVTGEGTVSTDSESWGGVKSLFR